MATEHNVLTDPELHEPKGVAAASAGDAYIADGAGSGTWKAVGGTYGGIGLFDSAGVAMATIGTTPSKVVAFATDMPSAGVTSAFATGDITILTAGTYQISFDISFATAASGDAGTYQFRLRVNGIESATQNAKLGCRRDMSGTSDVGAAGFGSILTCAAADVLTIYVESDSGPNTDDISITELHFLAHLLAEA